MANTIKHKRGTTTPTAGQLVVGEIAINTSTGAVFTKTDGGSVVALNSNNPVFTGNVTAGTNLVSNYSAGDEGGEIQLAKPATNSTLAGTVSIDIYQNKLRFFENGGNSRGAYIDITACSNGVASNLLSGGGGGGSVAWGGITGTVTDQTDLTTYVTGLGYQTASDVSTYVTGLGYLTDAPSDGSEYVRKNGSWSVATGGGGGTAIPVYDNGVTYSLNDQVIYSNRFWYMSNYVGAAGYDPVTYPAYWTEISPYTDTGLTDAPSDSQQYVRYNGSWVVNSGFTFGDSPSDGNYYVRMGSTGWAQIGNGTDTIATQQYVTSQGYATTGDVSTAVSGLVSTANARKQAVAESARAVLNDSAYGFDGSGYYYTSFMSGAFNFTVTNSQFSSGGKWFGFKTSGTIYSAMSINLSGGVVTITAASTSAPDAGTGLFYTEDGGTTWFESTIPIGA